ncbi:hypothetical protein V1477_004962 [Vespula maculifrons]|uniref:Uncharacterized protein n=1 Tax=Vespula maculifrons TaxID=7453 RepID=A0ABD2CNA5_VESMC
MLTTADLSAPLLRTFPMAYTAHTYRLGISTNLPYLTVAQETSAIIATVINVGRIKIIMKQNDSLFFNIESPFVIYPLIGDRIPQMVSYNLSAMLDIRKERINEERRLSTPEHEGLRVYRNTLEMRRREQS